MNIERFALPAIIAAGLHSSLLLFAPSGGLRPLVPTPATPVVVAKPIPLAPPAETAAGGGDQAVSPPVAPLRLPEDPTPRPRSLETPWAPVEIKPMGASPVTISTPTFSGPGDGGIFSPGAIPVPDVGRLDRVPRALHQPSPDYPRVLRQAGVTGVVVVDFVVGADGTVEKVDVVSADDRGLAGPTVSAVSRWKFEPGKLGGRPVRFRMRVPVEFKADRD